MDGQYVIREIRDGVAWLTLSDPPKRNAMSKPLADQLLAALEHCRYDPQVRVAVLRGQGGNFCSGGDVKGMAERVKTFRAGEEPQADPRQNLRNLNRIISLIRAMEKPVIGWLEGAVAGGGTSLAMACDFSLATEDATMSFAFVNIALAPDTGSTVLLAGRVGVPRATELMMTGRRFSGREAADWGIITEALPTAEALEEKVRKTAARLAAGPGGSYAAIKQALNAAAFPTLDTAMEAECHTQLALIRHPHHWEAVEAFFQKRKPVYHKEEE